MRETFTSRLGTIATMIGVAVGLGNVWRFPYLVGQYGGAAFVLLYLLFAVLIGIPALIAEWSLGRHTRRGPVGAFQSAGLPGGRWFGFFFFFTVTVATGYYTNAIGWVVYHAVAQALGLVGSDLNAAAILPPDEGFNGTSFLLQMGMTGALLFVAAVILIRGLREGIQRVSTVVTPLLFLSLLILIVRSVTLPGADAGLEWLILKFEPESVTAGVAIAALGQVMFSLALGGTFMVIYGSYLRREDTLPGDAIWTVAGDTGAGLLAGLAIFPAVFALGLEPESGPGLIFATLPQVFSEIPLGGLFGLIFFSALAAAAFLSGIAALEVLVAGVTDNTRLDRSQATWIVLCGVFFLALPPMVNMKIFGPWDLTFGSGMQTFGALLATLTVGWALKRSTALSEIGGGFPVARHRFLYLWIRYVVPGAILIVGLTWFLTDVLGVIGGV